MDQTEQWTNTFPIRIEARIPRSCGMRFHRAKLFIRGVGQDLIDGLDWISQTFTNFAEDTYEYSQNQTRRMWSLFYDVDHGEYVWHGDLFFNPWIDSTSPHEDANEEAEPYDVTAMTVEMQGKVWVRNPTTGQEVSGLSGVKYKVMGPIRRWEIRDVEGGRQGSASQGGEFGAARGSPWDRDHKGVDIHVDQFHYAYRGGDGWGYDCVLDPTYCLMGIPALAVEDGYVKTISYSPSYGCYVTISHGRNIGRGQAQWYNHIDSDAETNRVTGGLYTLYAHLKAGRYPESEDGCRRGKLELLWVKGRGYWGIEEDDPVRAGQVVGNVGRSGNARRFVPHLHFEIRRSHDLGQGLTLDPEMFLFPYNTQPRCGKLTSTPGSYTCSCRWIDSATNQCTTVYQ